ncbi:MULTISPECIES: LacI family DNA-binding transcriptional regulator [unclassified Pseudarthrobacter]|uniref:LacI family DNA-binding transcriptional regulator n=1 Tax=unclassified Pseudarthrobacter TaxID=2647000 RepID=UPI0011313BFF|nr:MULTISPECIES: LacI family DNA-binding transcriptional regulator [unclassified Pseudarthrobacter]QDG60951.1 LacI family transcriptional regulator [Pseudarthrobacter sp. NIBRBAC000502771]WRT14820.1 LacI family DNA-binding transcriptional regulator [Pseudarthrobacter sp. LT1]
MVNDSQKTRRPTIYDVAKHAGVSPSLVSLVLQDPARVSAKRREAVRAAISELGYRPSRAATALASSRTKSIGLVIDDYRNLWFVDLLRGMESALSPEGYRVMLADSRPGENRISEAVDGLLAMHVDALVIAAEPSPSMLAGAEVPTVVAGWRSGVPAGADLISNDDEGGGVLAADHLLGLGHTKIGHLSGVGGAAAHRRAGFARRLKEAGVHLHIAGESGGTSEEDGYASACWILDHHPDTTAIFAANDTMALGALAAFRERGLLVPGDISLIGYDNSTLAKSRYLDITTVDNRSDMVGVGVARVLLARLEDPSLRPSRTLIDPELVLRSTTASR